MLLLLSYIYLYTLLSIGLERFATKAQFSADRRLRRPHNFLILLTLGCRKSFLQTHIILYGGLMIKVMFCKWRTEL